MREGVLRLLAFVAAMLIEAAVIVLWAQAAIRMRDGLWWGASLGDVLSFLGVGPGTSDTAWTGRLLEAHAALILLMLASAVLLVALWLDGAFRRFGR